MTTLRSFGRPSQGGAPIDAEAEYGRVPSRRARRGSFRDSPITLTAVGVTRSAIAAISIEIRRRPLVSGDESSAEVDRDRRRRRRMIAVSQRVGQQRKELALGESEATQVVLESRDLDPVRAEYDERIFAVPIRIWNEQRPGPWPRTSDRLSRWPPTEGSTCWSGSSPTLCLAPEIAIRFPGGRPNVSVRSSESGIIAAVCLLLWSPRRCRWSIF